MKRALYSGCRWASGGRVVCVVWIVWTKIKKKELKMKNKLQKLARNNSPVELITCSSISVAKAHLPTSVYTPDI